MSGSATAVTVRVSGALRDFVVQNVGAEGNYQNVSEYLRDLIRRDKECTEHERFEHLKAELQRAFAAPESSYEAPTAQDIIARSRG